MFKAYRFQMPGDTFRKFDEAVEYALKRSVELLKYSLEDEGFVATGPITFLEPLGYNFVEDGTTTVDDRGEEIPNMIWEPAPIPTADYISVGCEVEVLDPNAEEPKGRTT